MRGEGYPATKVVDLATVRLPAGPAAGWVDDGCCPRCGADVDYTEIQAFGETVRRIPVRSCCAPPPTADQLRRAEEDRWLAEQRAMAGDAPSGFITLTYDDVGWPVWARVAAAVVLVLVVLAVFAVVP